MIYGMNSRSQTTKLLDSAKARVKLANSLL